MKQEYNLTRDFEKIQEIFTRIKTEDIEYYDKEALRVIGEKCTISNTEELAYSVTSWNCVVIWLMTFSSNIVRI